MDGMTGMIRRTGMTTMEVKSVGTSPVTLLKLATFPLPPPNKVEFGVKWVEMTFFFGHSIAEESPRGMAG